MESIVLFLHLHIYSGIIFLVITYLITNSIQVFLLFEMWNDLNNNDDRSLLKWLVHSRCSINAC